MIKRLLFAALLITSPVQAVTLFGHSSNKVKNLRNQLETIKSDYDNIRVKASNLELELANAQTTINLLSGELIVLRQELIVSRAECDQLKGMDDKRHEDFAKQVDRLMEATKRLEDLERELDEMSKLPAEIFGDK